MSSNSLPPGLITRNGTPVSRNQRLPSLKNSPNLQLTTGSALSPSYTKGGFVKRQFKPNITTTRSINSGSTSDTNSNETKEKCRRDVRSKETKQKAHKKKELVQLGAAVFNGISTPVNTNRSSGESTRATSCSSSRSKRKFEVKKCDNEVKTEKDWEKSLYKDDFIEYSDDDSMEETPKGWENFSATKAENMPLMAPNADLINFNNLINSHDEVEKLYLFQLPDLFVKKPEGKIGKLRFYKSGRVELVDEESRLEFDMFKYNEEKQNAKCNVIGNNRMGIVQEVISLSGNQLTCFGALSSGDVYVAVPKIPENLQS